VTEGSYLWLAILFAILSGVCFSINALVMKHYVQAVKFTPMQLNLDGYMVCNIWLTASFVYVIATEGFIYSWYDLLLATLASWISLASTVSITIALQTGKGGPIQAIDSLKSLV
jgi:hypothetical protein